MRACALLTPPPKQARGSPAAYLLCEIVSALYATVPPSTT